MQTFRQVFVIQCKSNGVFLTEELSFANSLRRAGRLYDIEEAQETARFNLSEDYEIHSFYEPVLH
jgi:hypothetical protein